MEGSHGFKSEFEETVCHFKLLVSLGKARVRRVGKEFLWHRERGLLSLW
jgi:hypothetical protein